MRHSLTQARHDAPRPPHERQEAPFLLKEVFLCSSKRHAVSFASLALIAMRFFVAASLLASSVDAGCGSRGCEVNGPFSRDDQPAWLEDLKQDRAKSGRNLVAGIATLKM